MRDSHGMAQRMRRTKGLLAFLEDSATLFPYDVDTCKKKMLQTPRKQRRQRHRRQQQQQEDNPVVQMMATTLAEQLSIQKPRVVLLFFCDPEQAYSIQVRNRILQVLCHNNMNETGNEFVRSKEQEESSRNDILCCVVSLAQGGEQSQSSSSSSSRDCVYSAPQRDFLSGTGLVVTHVASSLALHNIFLPRVAGYPHVMLVQASDGQAIGGKHEELALEWNTPETVRQRWLEGSSGLDCAQQSLAAILFPTACTIL